MPRKNFFEFEDLDCCPQVFRNSITDFLRCYINLSNIYKPAFNLIYQVLKQTKSCSIIDLCSGGSGPHKKLLQYLNDKEDLSFKFESITLTDLKPNYEAFELVSSNTEQIKYINKSVDACHVKSDLKGMRTLFTAFHHMSHEQGKLIIKNAIESNEAIGVFEMTENTPFAIIRVALTATIAAMLLIPFSRPFSWKKLFSTPLSSLINGWDAVASCFRTYDITELMSIAIEADVEAKYTWDSGKKWSYLHLCNVTYLIGRPKI